MDPSLGAWGVLPVVVPLFAFVAARLGAVALDERVSGRASASDRAVAGVVLAFALAIAAVRLLSVVHLVVPWAIVGLLVVAAGVLARVRRRARFVWPEARTLRDAGVVCTLVVAGAGFALAVLAARWLPVWQWDALGYHLPFVHFTLAAGSVDGVPRELEYVGSYPHDVELFFVALRACLPDDRLIDLGQVPFGVGGAIVTGALARRMGAEREASVVAGLSWLLVPAVFLQLPTDYVDVATATFALSAIYVVLAPCSTPWLLVGGAAIGLLAGSKPSGPLPALVLLVLLCVRGLRARRRGAVLFALSLAVAFGGESYGENLVRHANPVWPVRLDLGPLHLAGTHALGEVLASGASAPHLTGPLALRVLRSLFALTSPPAYDMRVGGFGAITLVALPFALLWLVRRRSLLTWATFACTLLSPDPAVARYVLAFPALVLAAAAAQVAAMSRSTQRTLGVAAAVVGAFQLAYAAPGLAGEGPPLLAYAGMTDAERAVAVGAEGRPSALAEARSRMGAGEALAFDETMDLCDLAWDASQSYRVVFLPPSSAVASLEEAHARVLVAGDAAPAGLWAAAHPEEFERIPGRVSCRKGGCSMYVRVGR